MIFESLKQLLELKIKRSELGPLFLQEPPLGYGLTNSLVKMEDLLSLPSQIFPKDLIFSENEILELIILIENLLKLNHVIVHLNPIFPNRFRYEILTKIFQFEVLYQEDSLIQFHFCAKELNHCIMEKSCVCEQINSYLQSINWGFSNTFCITD